MDNLARNFITVTDYLEIERKSALKHEYYYGEIFAMAGAKEIHNLIVSNLVAIFHSLFKNKSCVVYPSDMKVVVDQNTHYTYPDITIVCGKRNFLDNHTDSLLNPTIIIEVLSESTETYDRGKKFEAYRTIPSLTEYMLVSTDRKKVELFSKNTDSKWFLSESGIDEIIHIPTLSVTIQLYDIYEKIDFFNTPTVDV